MAPAVARPQIENTTAEAIEEEDPISFDHTGGESEDDAAMESAPQTTPTFVQPFAGKTPVDPIKYTTNAAAIKPARKKRARKRCRDCGLDAEDIKWSEYHPAAEATPGRFFSCETPKEERCAGFPCPEGTRLPPRKKSKK